MGIYDRGRHVPVFVPEAALRRIYSEQKVILVKDSSADPARRDLALSVRARRTGLRLLSGDEFHCVGYLQAGYDGLLLGGGVFNAYMAGRIIGAVAAGDLAQAERIQKRMNRIMWAVYGGRKIRCWLAGEKLLLVKMGVFRTRNCLLEFPLTKRCIRAIDRVLLKDADVLTPWKVRSDG